jgi:prepilin-type N-terminal cleavage/methylation domain-containing protein
MKRAGFTMIELIFVIVILGILAAVALPKFIGVSTNAKASRCAAFAGTMTRTVGPAIWSEAAINDTNVTAQFTDGNISAQITVPAECGDLSDWGAAARNGTDFTVEIDGVTYEVNATAASSSTSPEFTWAKQP